MTSKKTPTIKFLFSLAFICLISFVIASPDALQGAEPKLSVNPTFVGMNDEAGPDISMDFVTIDEDVEGGDGVLHYTVQPGDNLGKIASMFGTTIAKIKQTNKLGGSIKPGQKLVIANEDVGFLYTISEKINVKIFTNKYNLNTEEFMSLNYIQDESEMLQADQDVFINIANEQAYNNGLLERPKPAVVIKPKITYKPIINKPGSQKPKPAKNPKVKVYADDDENQVVSKRSGIISQSVYKGGVKNGFYLGYCTWYAAIISPEFFPYTAEGVQERPFGGNANQRCANAKDAGFRVVWNSPNKPVRPGAGSLVVYSRGGASAAGYGHVGKVQSVDGDEGTFVVKDMNYVGKFIVTQRREDIDNNNIKCYIYPKK